MTVVLMVSKKKKHFEHGLKPWEYELPIPISSLVVEKATKLLAAIPFDSVMDECLEERQSRGDDASLDDDVDILSAALKKLGKKMELEMKPLMDFSKKMTKGSIIDTHQIVTLSKQRIISPAKRTDHLYGICIPADFMIEVDRLLMLNYISSEALDDTPEK